MMNEILEISIEEIFDYMQCPLKHHIKHTKGMKENTHDGKQEIAFRKAFHQTVYYYYSHMQTEEGRTPTLKQLYEKFSKLWYEMSDLKFEGVMVDDLAQSTRAARVRREKYLNQGYAMLKNFYEENEGVEQYIIAVNHDYRISFGNIVVKGKFELIRERLDKKTKNRFIEVVDFRTGKRKPEGFFMRNDLHATFMHYAFAVTFKNQPDYFLLDYPSTNDSVRFVRNNNDYKRMLSVVKGVANGMNEGDIYPRQTFQCKQCPFKDVCDVWKF